MPIHIVQQWERDTVGEATELAAFAEGMAPLMGMRDTFTLGSRERIREGRFAMDTEAVTWKLFWDEAAKHFKRAYGYLPTAKARKLLAMRSVSALLQDRRRKPR